MAEKSVSDLPRDLRVLYNRGSDALSRDNFEYAVDLFNQVLAREPAFHEIRRALRAAQVRKAGAGGGFLRKVFHTASSSPLVVKAQVALREDPARAMAVAEQILNNDPTNSSAHRVIVEAANVLDLPNTAALSLEILHKNHPRDKEVGIELANRLADIGDVERGERILADLCAAFPADNDLAQAFKNVSARKTLDQGGYEALSGGTGSYRDILKDKDEAIALEQENRQVKAEDVADRLIREYTARLPNEPDNPKVLRNLAELHTQKKNFDQALAFYDRLRGTGVGSDPTLDRAIAETRARKYDHEISLLDPDAPDHAEQVARLENEKQAYLLAECQKRVERFPSDLQIRFEMGQLYFQAGKISEAIQEFQRSQNNPHRRIASMSYLAQCFAQRKMFDLAARTFQSALKEKPVMDDEKKELIYLLGGVLEAMGKKDEAVDQFKLIYEVEYGYRDVAAKVEAYYSEKSGPQG